MKPVPSSGRCSSSHMTVVIHLSRILGYLFMYPFDLLFNHLFLRCPFYLLIWQLKCPSLATPCLLTQPQMVKLILPVPEKNAMKTCGERRLSSTCYRSLHWMGVCWLSPVKWSPNIHWIWGWVGRTVGMDVGAEIMIIDPGGNLTPVNQCIAIHFTDWAVRLSTVSTVFEARRAKCVSRLKICSTLKSL